MSLGRTIARIGFFVFFTLTCLSSPNLVQAADSTGILDLDFKELMQLQITSAGRKAQNLSEVPAAVYVIDQADIHNSGVTSIPEALRMVPGIQVARISSSKWAIASRGFNGTFSNKLLVQIDGRSVYSPAYSGVYWDVQNVLLEDIERIEVIRGPGATLWGANAVNGVINIITKQSSDTQGGLVSVGGGNYEDKILSARYGLQFNENVYGRFYVSHHEQDEFQYNADHSDANDDWNMTYGGFRLDGDVGLANSWTVQGDIYSGEADQQIEPYWTANAFYPTRVNDEIDTSGYNLLARWQHNFSETNSWTLQTYYDNTDRDEIYLGQIHRTFDVDFQHRFQLWQRNDIVWGLGYRNVQDDFDNSYMVHIDPDSATKELFSAFIQDEITLVDNSLWLTLGSKLENNDYTGTEIQPSARLLWKPAANHSVWVSVSKAVRTPSRAEDSGKVVTFKYPPNSMMPQIPANGNAVYIYGNSDMDPEVVVAYEAGYRFSRDKHFALDMTIFYNDYKNLTNYGFTWQVPNLIIDHIEFINGLKGTSQGLEASVVWEPLTWITTELSYSYICLSMSTDSSNSDESSAEVIAEESSPKHQISLRTTIELRDNLQLNLWGRYVDQLKKASPVAEEMSLVVPSYLAVDANISWKIQDNLEFMLVGQNLFDNAHLEFINEYFTPPIEIKRSVYAKMTWKF
jgi:iron complex outermembrane receptor protein